MTSKHQLFDTSAFTVRPRNEVITIDSLPKGEELQKAKVAYAEYLFSHPDDRYNAAVVAVGERLAGYVWNVWAADLDVVAHMKAVKAKAESDDEVLGTKTDMCYKLLQLSDKYKNSNPREALAALALVAELRGFKFKPSDVQVNNTQIVNKVMVVKDFGSADAWEDAAVSHQKDLTNSSNKNRSNNSNNNTSNNNTSNNKNKTIDI